MKSKYIVTFCFLCGLLVFSACTKTTDTFGDADKSAFFVKLYGGEEDQIGFDIRQKEDGGYLIAGTTQSFINSSTDRIDTLDSPPNNIEEEWGAYLISTDSEGNELWSVLYGLPNIYVIGSRLSVSQTGDYLMLVNYYNKMAVVEVNNLGQTIRKKPLNSKFNWIISGANTNNRFKGNMHLIEEEGQERFLIIGNVGERDNDSLGVVKLSRELDIIWEKKYKVGIDWDNGIDIYPLGDTYVILSVADDTALSLLQITSDGRIIDKREYGEIEDVYATDNEPRMIPSMDGGFIVVASGEPFSKDGQLRFLQLNGSLDKIDEKCLTAEGIEEAKLSARDIKALPDGYIVLASKLNKNSNKNEQDFYLIKTDFEGNVLFSESYGNIENNDAARVIPTQDGGFAILGTTDFSVNTVISLVKTNAQGKLESLQ